MTLQNTFNMEANTMNPDETAPLRLLLREQSDLGPCCLQYRQLKYTADERADNNC